MRLSHLIFAFMTMILMLLIFWTYTCWLVMSVHAQTIYERMIVPSSSEPIIIQDVIWDYSNPSKGG